MTQEQVNKIFKTNLGSRIDMIYVTSDDKPFIRYDEALEHTLSLEDSNITFWYPEEENKIYIVKGSFSSYDDYRMEIFKAFYKKEDAEKYVEKAERVLKAMSEHIADSFKKTRTLDETSKEYALALDIWSEHQNLEEFNRCFIEEVTIL
jgi:hypothetical protein